MLKMQVLRPLPRDSAQVCRFLKRFPHGSYGEVKFGKNYLILTAALSTK